MWTVCQREWPPRKVLRIHCGPSCCFVDTFYIFPLTFLLPISSPFPPPVCTVYGFVTSPQLRDHVDRFSVYPSKYLLLPPFVMGGGLSEQLLSLFSWRSKNSFIRLHARSWGLVITHRWARCYLRCLIIGSDVLRERRTGRVFRTSCNHSPCCLSK